MGSYQRPDHPSNHKICVNLLEQMGLNQACPFQIQGQDPVAPSPHRLGDAAASALAALGVAMAAIWRHRTGMEEEVHTSVDTAIPQLMAFFMNMLNDVPVRRLLEDPKLLSTSDFYEAKNGRFVFLLNSYPHLRDINCRVLNCPFEVSSFTAAIAEWDAFELEDIIGRQGGTCIAVRTREEWVKSPTGALLKDLPVVDIEKLGDSDIEPLAPMIDIAAGKPLEGVRILDNTHVIAGPMAARICAEHGADVLLMSSPAHPDPRAMTLETAIGKRSSFCDLDNPTEQRKFWERLREADVYFTSYLSLDKRGFGPAELIKARPGLIYCDFHGWGKTGPWQQRGGFDQLACSATGFAHEEGQIRDDKRPSLPPTYLLNDYLAAMLGSAGIAAALQRRMLEGGSYRVHINLSRVAMWVQSLGMFESHEVSALPKPASIGPDKKPATIPLRGSARLRNVDGPQGRTTYLPTQITYTLGNIKPGLASGSDPTGVSPFEFRTRKPRPEENASA